MGGRGASSGVGGNSPAQTTANNPTAYGGYGSLQGLANAVQNMSPPQTNAVKGDYDGNGNAELIKYQQQTDDTKTEKFLAGLSKKTDVIDNLQTNEQWGFYNNPMQKMILKMGLNDKPTVLSKKDFDALATKTGAEVLSRGWSSDSSRDRFTESEFTHIGTGRYGDGLYFGSKSTASGYGSSMSTVMLSPNARVIDVRTLRSMMPKTGGLATTLRYSGTTGERQYYNDIGGESQWALKLGYNVIDAGWCKCVLTRDALIVRGKK